MPEPTLIDPARADVAQLRAAAPTRFVYAADLDIDAASPGMPLTSLVPNFGIPQQQAPDATVSPAQPPPSPLGTFRLTAQLDAQGRPAIVTFRRPQRPWPWAGVVLTGYADMTAALRPPPASACLPLPGGGTFQIGSLLGLRMCDGCYGG